MKLIHQSITIIMLLIISCVVTIAYGGEGKLDLSAAELLLADIEKDRDAVIQQRIVVLLQKYEAMGLSEKVAAPVLSFLAACSANKMVEIEESMTAEQLVAYANNVERFSADDDKIAEECLEVLQDWLKEEQQRE